MKIYQRHALSLLFTRTLPSLLSPVVVILLRCDISRKCWSYLLTLQNTSMTLYLQESLFYFTSRCLHGCGIEFPFTAKWTVWNYSQEEELRTFPTSAYQYNKTHNSTHSKARNEIQCSRLIQLLLTTVLLFYSQLVPFRG